MSEIKLSSQKKEKTRNKRFHSAVATLVTTIVGVGIFGIPYVMAMSGFWTGLFLLLLLGGATLLLHLIYGEVALRSQGRARLVGYINKYLTSKGKFLAGFVSVMVRYGALLAYMILAGEFLSLIFGGSDFFWSIAFFVVGIIVVFFGIRVIAKIEILMAFFLLATIIVVLVEGLPAIEISNLNYLSWEHLFLPYGVILWAIGGLPAIPEMKQILKKDAFLLKRAIVIATLIPILLYALFAFVVVGVSGAATSPDAISGLIDILNSNIVLLGAVFGAMAVFTSFLVMGDSLKKIFAYDYHLEEKFAWLIVCLVPLTGYLLHLRDFVAVLGFAGSILTGLEAIILIWVYQKAKKYGDRTPEYTLHMPIFVEYGLAGIFALGIIYQLFYYF